MSAYEKAFGDFLHNDVNVFSFWKGRVALYAILKALGIGKGDEVILPGYTCVVVPNAVRMTGAKPIYADISFGTYSIDPGLVEQKITSRTKAILVQHTYGIAAPVEKIIAIARPKGIWIIEDCAHVFGTKLNEKPLGLLGDASFFSSQWSKPYTTGLGGIAITQSPEIAVQLDKIHKEFVSPSSVAEFKLDLQYLIYNHFFSPQIYWKAQGILHFMSQLGLFVGSSSTQELSGEFPCDHTWRMSESQNRHGLIQLKNMRDDIERRRTLKKFYSSALQNKIETQVGIKKEDVLLRYPVNVDNKGEVLEKAKKERIELGSWFETPLHPIPLEKHNIFNYQNGECPNAEYAAKHVINLPMNRWITLAEANRIVEYFERIAR